jgi:ADP-ribosylglycohydrolase
MGAATREDRIIGALLGVHAGDSLGATFEFMSWDSIRLSHPRGLRRIVGGGPFQWEAGHATDDTDLTRAVLLAYRDKVLATSSAGGAAFDIGRTAGRWMLDWLDGKWPDREPGISPRDMGNATGIGLDKFRMTGDPLKAGAGPNQAGNGSLMRCIPTGLFENDIEKIIEQSTVISAITHDDRRCTIACAAYNVIVHELIAGSEVNNAIKKGLDIARRIEEKTSDERLKVTPVQDAIELGRTIEIQDLAEKGPIQLRGKGSGYVLESLTIAIAALRDSRSLVDVLVDVVRIGKDTDSNAAIAGGLLGARDGANAISEEWKEVLQFRDEFETITKEILGKQ